MSRIIRILETASPKELQEIERELAEGTLKREVDARLDKLVRQEKTCPVCNRAITPGEQFILEFGPHDFRQRASFDALDCLEYFTNHLKKIKHKEDEYY